MVFSQMAASAAAVGLGCGAGCGSSASAFLTTYVVSEGKNVRSAFAHVAAFYLGKMLSIVTVCVLGSVLGQAVIDENGVFAGFPLKKLVSVVMIGAALWLLYGWFRARKGCGHCRHCEGGRRHVPSLAVGIAYGLSPCAPLLMVLGYSVLLAIPEALGIGIVFSICSSVIPAFLTILISGALSMRIYAQLGRYLPWLQLVVYFLYLISGIYGIIG